MLDSHSSPVLSPSPRPAGLAAVKRLRPTARLAKWASWTLPMALTAVFWQPASWLWLAALVALAAVTIHQAVALLRFGEVVVERELPGVLPLGVASAVSLRLSGASVACRVQDFVPISFEVTGLPAHLEVPAEGWVEVTYNVRPLERGRHQFGRVDLLVASPLGLVEKRCLAGVAQTVRVLPNFRAVSKYVLLATADRLGQMGIRRTPRRGEGLDFRELREYREGDSTRQIDWAATARMRKLISRQYQEERNQQLFFLLDTGRRMHARDGELSHFDHVLNAVLLLSYVALSQGDSVGLLAFSGEDRWLPPQKGSAAINVILDKVFDLATSTAPPDYLAVAQRTMALQRRRALVVLVSNFRDEDSLELTPALDLLRRRHLVLIANLRERVLDDLLGREVSGFSQALSLGAAHHYLEARRIAWEKVRGRGVLALEAVPEQLPERMVNRYLEVKRAGIL